MDRKARDRLALRSEKVRTFGSEMETFETDHVATPSYSNDLALIISGSYCLHSFDQDLAPAHLVCDPHD